jgi:hypothetical protein
VWSEIKHKQKWFVISWGEGEIEKGQTSKMTKSRALQDALVEYRFHAGKKQKLDIEMFLVYKEDQIKGRLQKYLRKHKNLKFDIALEVRLGKLEVGEKRDEVIQTKPWFRSDAHIVNNDGEIQRKLIKATEKLLDSYDNFMRMGSGWFLIEVLQLELKIYKYKPLRGGCFAEALPEPYNRMRSILTFPQTGDEKCFLYCVLAHLFPQKKMKNDFHSYEKYEEQLNSDSLKYPVEIEEISTFEKDNELSINVYQLVNNNQKVFAKCVRVSENHEAERAHINLLLHKKHYHLITNMSPFLQYRNRGKRWQCSRCLTFHKTHEKMKRHAKHCNDKNKGTALVFPKVGTKHRFKNFKNISKAPFVMYCDLETYASPFTESDAKPNKTKKEAKHRALAFGLYCVCSEEEYCDREPIIYVGNDAIEKLFEELEKKLAHIHSIQKTVNHDIDMTKRDQMRHRKAKKCYICQRRFAEPQEKMRDHNHLKRKKNYLGPVCISCNLHCSDLKSKIPLFLHNAGRFDLHLLIEKLHVLNHQDFKVLPKTTETFTAMSLFGGNLEIRDSLNHLPNALADLIKLNKESGKQFHHTAKWVKTDKVSLDLITRKGVFPHGYMSDPSRLQDTKLPEMTSFYDPLSEKHISEQDYDHAKRVWDHFSCNSLEDYMRIYLTSDVTLLADVFETYRFFFKEKFGLDPAHYVSLPSLSYDCALKFTNCSMDYIHDEDMYHFIREAIKGGVSSISRRYAEANNPYLKDFDSNLPTSYIMYFDCNSLYSSVMTMRLPFENFEFLKPEEFSKVKNNIANYRDSDDIGYFVQCDLMYPAHVHDETRDLPLAPRHFLVGKEHLSPYNRELAQILGIKRGEGTKLISDQFDKKKYICHIANLKFYLEKGMFLGKIHRILKFRQKAFLKPYIEFCIGEKANTRSQIEKNLWKLACNSIFGKTITNLEKRCSVNFATTQKQFVNSVNSPRFKSANIINSKLVQTNKAYKSININSPYILGATVLELSKLVLFRWHYDFFLERYGRDNIELCMTDTDSLLYHIHHKDIYKDLKNQPKFDFSNYPSDSPFYNTAH